MSKIKAFMSKFWLMHSSHSHLSIIIATKAYILSKPNEKESSVNSPVLFIRSQIKWANHLRRYYCILTNLLQFPMYVALKGGQVENRNNYGIYLDLNFGFVQTNSDTRKASHDNFFYLVESSRLHFFSCIPPILRIFARSTSSFSSSTGNFKHSVCLH